MKVKDIIRIIGNPNAKVALYQFGGMEPIKEYLFTPIAEAEKEFAGWLDDEVLTVYNGTWWSTLDKSSIETYYHKPDYVVIEIK